MSQHRKTVRSTRSREDHELFKVTIPSFNPQLVHSLLMAVAPGDYLRPNQPFATLRLHKPPAQDKDQEGQEGNSDWLEESLTTHIGGTVERLGASFSIGEEGWSLKEGAKRGSLELLFLRQCQHFVKKQSMPNGNNGGNFNLSAGGEICPLCGKQIWTYMALEEESVTIDDLTRANDGLSQKDIPHLEWSIIINEQFTPTMEIAKVGEHELNYPALAKATYLLGQGEKPLQNGTIMKIRRVYCCHERIYEKRCQFCLQVIEDFQLQDFNRYLFQLGPLGSERSFTKGAALVHQQEEYISGILATNKLILILDLDNTILHSNQMSELEFSKILKLKEYFIIPKREMGSDGKLRNDFIIVKMRPFLKEFLFVVQKLFEVYIYTKGTRIYAEEICRWVRAQWAGEAMPYQFSTWPEAPQTFLKKTESFLPYRVVSRNEDSNLDTKSMQNILPNRGEYHLILDDRRDVWNNSPSWYYTRDYYYFFKKARGADKALDVGHFLADNEEIPPYKDKLIDIYNRMREDYPTKKDFQVQISEKDDYFLLFTAHTFKKMHHHFFQHLRKSKEQKNINLASGKEKVEGKAHPVSIQEIMKKFKYFLMKKKLRFFLAPEGQGANMISTVRRSLKMGAIVLKQTSEETPDFIIRGNSYIKFVKNHKEQIRYPVEEMSIRTDLTKEIVERPSTKSEATTQHPNIEKTSQKIDNKQPAIAQSSGNKDAASGESPSPAVSAQSKPEPSPRNYQSQMNQLKYLSDKGVPVISQTWIMACYQFSFKFRSQDFRLKDPLKEEVLHTDFNDVIARSAEKIRKEIGEQMSKELDSGAKGGQGKGQKEKQISEVVGLGKTQTLGGKVQG